MAIIDLQTPEWQYDSGTKELVVTFYERQPVDEPDPVNWRPTRKAVMRLAVPAGTQVVPI